MISCRFNGRLGNNLFQMATVIALAKKLNTDFIFDHTTWAGHRGEIPVDLSIFDFNFPRGKFNAHNQYNETKFEYHPIELVDNLCLSGFYQSWKYFENVRGELLNKYFVPNKQIAEKVNSYCISDKSLGISVRRGDYIMLQGNHCVLTPEYYQQAINKYFLDNVNEIYIFSDDIPWCKNIFGHEVHYVHESVGVQLFLMTKMKHLILSNSTFAWWGAYLNQNNGIVTVPDPWFGPSNSHNDTKDLHLPNWVKINHNINLHEFNDITPNMYE